MKTIKGFDLPSKMKALVLSDFKENPELTEVSTPLPKRGEVLVKIEYSPINPSDYMFLKGFYPTKKELPVVPGFEASGKVIASGDDFLSRRLLGKDVSCTAPIDGDGAWADYMLTNYLQAIPLKSSIDLEQGSMLFVNPFSVVGMIDIAKSGAHEAIANTAAASALGQMLNTTCIEKNIALVNIVRRREQEELLRNQGAKYVINSSSDNFKDELSRIFNQLNVTLAFDAISGQIVFDLVEALPDGGEVMIYGALAEEPLRVNPGSLIFENKKISGFYLPDWISKKNLLKRMSIINQVQKFLGEGQKISIHKRVSLEEVVEGINTYIEKMTAGKVLITPGRE